MERMAGGFLTPAMGSSKGWWIGARPSISVAPGIAVVSDLLSEESQPVQGVSRISNLAKAAIT